MTHYTATEDPNEVNPYEPEPQEPEDRGWPHWFNRQERCGYCGQVLKADGSNRGQVCYGRNR